MKVVFGGAFNPPTRAHLAVAKYLSEISWVDEVILMPVGDQYEKPGMVSASHRLAMLKLMVAKIDKTTVSELEINAPVALKTVETLEALQYQHPYAEFAFVMGADNLAQLSRWSQHERLVSNFKMLILGRDDFDVLELIKRDFSKYSDNFIVLKDFIPINMSATQFRENPEKSELLVATVAKYIQKNGLYMR